MNPSLNHNYSNLHRIGNENCQLTLHKFWEGLGIEPRTPKYDADTLPTELLRIWSPLQFLVIISLWVTTRWTTTWLLPYAWIRIVLSSGGLASLKPSWQGLRMAKPYTRSKILMHYGVPEQSLTTVWTVNIKKLHADIHKETSTATQKLMY